MQQDSRLDRSEPLADWVHRCIDIPERGLEVQRSATPEERDALAAALEILSIDALDVSYRIKPLPRGRYGLAGELTAAVQQACIVSLEPVPASVRETLDEEFWPVEDAPKSADGEASEREALAHTAPELIEQGEILLGRIVFEQLSTALDPYPRAEGAKFSWRGTGDHASSTPSPFAALSRLRDKT
ncbi:MAG: DUF177 domain-containing protein [Hyphomicrobiaceae bacterium]|nr:DUF177 domain-containing protein [Hyphomicrobiaceae bacterium]